ncbi:hypothetical protein WJX77_007438 [Trebouxia sp. C0004]
MKWIPHVAGSPSPASAAPTARMGHIAVAVDARESWGDEILIVHGGLSEGKYALGDVVVFQTEGHAWSRPDIPSAGPHARAFHCAAVVSTKVFMFGGHVWVKEKKGLQKFNDLWCLNTDNWEWHQIEVAKDAPHPSARDFACIVALDGGRLLVHGGLDAAERRLDDAWIFDTVTSTWSELKMNGIKPKARYGHCMCRVDSRVLMFGGENNTSLANDLWTLRGLGLDGEEAPAWIPLELPGNAPAPRKGHSCTCLGLWLVVMGGRTADVGWFRTKTDTFLNDVVVMDREGAVQWRSPPVGGDAPAPREFHTLTPLTKGRLMLLGGGNGKQIFGDCWWLDTEGEAVLNPSLSDQSIQAYLTSSHGRPGGSRPLANYLHTPKSIVGSSEGFRHDMAQAERDSLAGLSEVLTSQTPSLIPDTGAWYDEPNQATEQQPQHPGLTHLRRRLGLSLQPAMPLRNDQSRAAEQGEASAQPPRQTARQQFSNCTYEELTLRDIDPLLVAYKQMAASKESEHLKSLHCNSPGDAKQLLPGRFAHCSSSSLTLNNVSSILTEYQQHSSAAA